MRLRKKNRFSFLGLDLKNPLKALKTRYTETHLVKFGVVSTKDSAKFSFASSLESKFIENGFNAYAEEISTNLFTITIYGQETQSVASTIVKSLGGEVVQLPPGSGTPSEEIEAINNKIALLNDEKAKIEKQLSDLCVDKLSLLRVIFDFYNWKLDREIALNEAVLTKRVAVFEGWCESKQLDNLKANFDKSGVVCLVEKIEPKEGEEPPVALKNHPLIEPFEIVTKLNGMPGYKDLDPTPFMAFFFFLFFGLALTDVGYGLTLMILSLPFLVYFVISDSAKQFAKLIFLVGLSTSIVGIFFGGYFGISMSKMPEFLQALQVFDPIANPLPVFYLALAMGVIQVMFGIFLRVVSEAKNGRLVEGLLTSGTWLFLFVALILFGASSLGYLTSVSEEKMVTLVYVAAIAVMIGNGMVGKTIGEKIKLSLLSAYGSVSYFSDILSYSRLLALGLATSALAFAVNLIAGMVNEMIPYVGIVFAIMVLLVGHAFTLAINTLGSFIHSARLQFVEFFGKFIASTGKEFKPLTRKKSYVHIIKDSG